MSNPAIGRTAARVGYLAAALMLGVWAGCRQAEVGELVVESGPGVEPDENGVVPVVAYGMWAADQHQTVAAAREKILERASQLNMTVELKKDTSSFPTATRPTP